MSKLVSNLKKYKKFYKLWQKTENMRYNKIKTLGEECQ